MRVRKLDSENDMTFGNGGLNFYENQTEGVAQNVYTRLKLFMGEWFLDEDAGTDWFGKCLGKNTATTAMNEIKRVIAHTEGVTNVGELRIESDADRRSVMISGPIDTAYGKTTINYNGSFYIGEKHGTY